MATKPSGGKPPKVSSGVEVPLKDVVKEGAALAALTMKGATSPARIAVFVAYGVLVCSAIVIALPPYLAIKQVAALVVLVASGLALLVLILKYGRKRLVSADSGQRIGARPIQSSIQLTKPEYHLAKELLTQARKAAFDYLKIVNNHLQDRQIRANIFLPVYSEKKNSVPYRLRIPPGLHLMMKNTKEIAIAFEPGQGATGCVFENGEFLVTYRQDKQDGSWDEKFEITDDLAKIIDPNLQWILSVPIVSAGRILGVMNIDGLQHRFDVDAIYTCRDRIVGFPTLIGECLSTRVQTS